MNKTELGKAIYKISNIKGDFILRSGRKANEYFDKYLFESNPVILANLTDHMSRMLPLGIERLAGLEMGGIPIVTALSLKTGIPALFVRKKAKSYGTCKIAEGGDFKGKKLVIIEDVVTSGGAIADAVKVLRERGGIVQHVCCVIDREDSGQKTLEKLGLTFIPLFTKSKLENYSGTN